MCSRAVYNHESLLVYVKALPLYRDIPYSSRIVNGIFNVRLMYVWLGVKADGTYGLTSLSEKT